MTAFWIMIWTLLAVFLAAFVLTLLLAVRYARSGRKARAAVAGLGSLVPLAGALSFAWFPLMSWSAGPPRINNDSAPAPAPGDRP